MNKKLLCAFILGVLLPGLMACPEEVTTGPGPGAFGLYVSFDVDPMFALGLGVIKHVRLEPLQRDLLLSADVSVPVFLLDLKHFEVNVAARMSLFSVGPISVANRLGFFAMTTSNDIYSGVEWGIKEGLLIGYLGEDWHLAAQAEYGANLLTYLAQSALYRDMYPGAKDGWYACAGGRLKLGVQGGIVVGGGVSLNLRGGYTLTERLNAYTIPFYLNVSTSYRF
jgi:hypothetical protein